MDSSLRYEFKIEYSGGKGTERWIKFFIEKDLVNNWTMNDLIERIRDMCSFYPSTRAYFSVQYCTLCAVLIEKCAVLNMKLCSIEI